ncbi:unnamed protein product [Closterium sp. NIES-54]
MVLSRRRRFAVNGAGLAAEGPLGIPVGVLIGFVALVACVIATGYYATSRANQEAAEAKAKLAEMEKRWAERGGLSQSQGGQAEPPPGGLGTTQAGGMSQMKMDAGRFCAVVVLVVCFPVYPAVSSEYLHHTFSINLTSRAPSINSSDYHPPPLPLHFPLSTFPHSSQLQKQQQQHPLG